MRVSGYGGADQQQLAAVGAVTDADTVRHAYCGSVTSNSMAASCSGDLPTFSRNGSQRGSSWRSGEQVGSNGDEREARVLELNRPVQPLEGPVGLTPERQALPQCCRPNLARARRSSPKAPHRTPSVLSKRMVGPSPGQLGPIPGKDSCCISVSSGLVRLALHEAAPDAH